MTCQRLVDGDTEEKSLVAVVFHHKSMTASPLHEIALALYSEVLKSGKHQGSDIKTIKSILKQVNKEFSELCRKRNYLLHGTWLVGRPNDTNEPRLQVAQYTTSE
jgi:hypothetical protein